MKKLSLVLVGVLILGGVLFVGEANAQTLSDLQVQIQALLVQVQALQAQVQQSSGVLVPSSVTVPSIPSASCVTVSSNLSRGNRGTAVTLLQQTLKQVGAYSGPVTGFFGPLTQSAVSAFQGESGLPAAGAMDAQTAAAINRLSCPAATVPTSASTSTSAQPLISVTSPSGAEVWKVGETRRITWTSSGVNNVRLYVYIEGSNLGSGSTNYISDSITNAGYYDWTISANALPAGNSLPRTYRIRVDDVDSGSGSAAVIGRSNSFTIYTDTSTTTSTIPTTPSITVLSPNGGEVWKVGETRRITWQSSGISTIQIDLYDNRIAGSGQIVKTLAAYHTISPSQGYFDWTIPSAILENNDGKNFTIHIYDGSSRSDTSDRAFSIASAGRTHGTAPYNYGWDDFTSGGTGDHSAQILADYKAHPDQYGYNPFTLSSGQTYTGTKYLLRLYKFCSDHWIDRKEKIPLPATYSNYTGSNRYQQHCINDGSFDSYYDEAVVYEGTSPTTPLSAPTWVSINVSGSDVVLNWNSVSGAYAYGIYKDQNQYRIAWPTTTTWTDVNPTCGVAHTYYIDAYDGSGGRTSAKSTGMQAGISCPTTTTSTLSVNLAISPSGFSPSTFTAAPGQSVTLSLISSSTETHTLRFDNPLLNAVSLGVVAGDTRTITFTAPTAIGEYAFRCDVPSHATRDEVGKMIVSSSVGGTVSQSRYASLIQSIKNQLDSITLKVEELLKNSR
ncbi:MAG: peptidoglycan-binding protein [Candidatus Jorgensenbacteria bacterium]|nr:peptidoglycan-binding protein [Candidatus Jorgensenbacteria bacterium]